jgi:hypothetical protein
MPSALEIGTPVTDTTTGSIWIFYPRFIISGSNEDRNNYLS